MVYELACIYTILYICYIVFYFQLCGGATLALGVWMKFDRETFMALHIAQGSPGGPMFDRIPYALMGIGASIIVVCFVGGCGACAESICFLWCVSRYISYFL